MNEKDIKKQQQPKEDEKLDAEVNKVIIRMKVRAEVRKTEEFLEREKEKEAKLLEPYLKVRENPNIFLVLFYLAFLLTNMFVFKRIWDGELRGDIYMFIVMVLSFVMAFFCLVGILITVFKIVTSDETNNH